MRAAAADSGPADAAAARLLQEALETRPAWSPALLQERAASVADVPASSLATVALQLCYQFHNGESCSDRRQDDHAALQHISEQVDMQQPRVSASCCMQRSLARNRDTRWAPSSLPSLEKDSTSTHCQLLAGPWRGLWIKRGYDPRRAKTDAERRAARSYQVIDVKLPAARCGF